MADVELIISANGCTDNTKWYLQGLKNQFDALGFENNFKYIWSDLPLGYSKACNEAIKLTTSDKIVLLNNDVILLSQQKNTWLNLLNDSFVKNDRCGISCVLKNYSKITERDFAVFFCVMIGRKVFDAIGLLNEDYDVGGSEDTEFCIEAENAGFEVIQSTSMKWNEEAKLYVGVFPLYHRGEGTVFDKTLVPEWQKIFDNNLLRLGRKYNREWYKWKLSNNYERAIFLNGDNVFPREKTRYEWASKNVLGKKILEIGCSTGYGIQFLTNDIDYTGLDYDETIIEVAKQENWSNNSKFVYADINKYELEQYDTIIAFEVIEHLDNGLELVERLKKHCKRLLITVPRKEPVGFWGPHHKLHNLDESMFKDFDFEYINEHGHLLKEPEDALINLMLCKYDS
jgi:SAM-dependent methyltransferase